MSLIKADVMRMLVRQDQVNRSRNQRWLYAGYPFLREIVLRGAGAINGHGKRHLDPQFQPEIGKLRAALTDMWGAILSTFIVKGRGSLDYAASAIVAAAKPHTGVTGAVVFDGVEYRFSEHKLSTKLEVLVGLAAAGRVSLPLFEAVMAECGLGWDEFIQAYMNDAGGGEAAELERKELACT